MARPTLKFAALIALMVLATLVFGGENAVKKTNKTLVILDDLAIRQTHSQFFTGLIAMGQELTFVRADDPALSLTVQGQIAYDNLVLFAPGVDAFGGDFDVPSVTEFIDSGRNAIIAVSSEISDSMRELALDCGVEFGEQHTQVIDHRNYDVSDADGDHTLIAADNFLDNDVIFAGKISYPVLYTGIAHTVKGDNDFVTAVLSSSPFGYSHSPDEPLITTPRAVGQKASLVSVLQARNNARVVISGSTDMFSNKYFTMSVQKIGNQDITESGNSNFCLGLAGWVIGERGVLRVHSFDYKRPEDTERPKIVTIKEEIETRMTIEEWVGSEWVPYLADDVQLEWVMLDPYVRAFMKHDETGVYTHKFTLPDVYGIFKFRLRYRKLGYTFLDMEDVLPVRPFRHTEYERFIPAAFPYYAASFSMLIGFVLLSAVYLYSKN